jgi:hypothetical protein
MSIHYYCRHCQTKVGELDQKHVQSEYLGFQQLNHEERMDMITYTTDGDIQVKTICEDCQEALERNPDYHSLQTFIQ